KDGKAMPYLVLSKPDDPHRRVVWLGWGETWRLRDYSEEAHANFWLGMTRYAAEKSGRKDPPGLDIWLGRTFAPGESVTAEVRAPAASELRIWALGDAAESEPERPPLKAIEGRPGWFAARFRAGPPGEYGVQLRSPETGEVPRVR